MRSYKLHTYTLRSVIKCINITVWEDEELLIEEYQFSNANFFVILVARLSKERVWVSISLRGTNYVSEDLFKESV